MPRPALGPSATALRFAKMHGLGNDFMVMDLVTQSFGPTARLVNHWADRRTGVGFDQLLTLEPPSAPDVDFDYRIFNADGSSAEQCGNGARCLARFVHLQGLSPKPQLKLRSPCGGWVRTTLEGPDVGVELGPPSAQAHEVPFLASFAAGAAATWRGDSGGGVFVHSVETSAGPVEVTPVSMGNPHGVLFVDDVRKADVTGLGGELSRHPSFPQGANIGFCQIVDRGYIRLRVHERGVGETRACGTGACAAAVAGRLRGKLDAAVKVSLPGGKLRLHWQGAGARVKMSGAATLAYEGVIKA